MAVVNKFMNCIRASLGGISTFGFGLGAVLMLSGYIGAASAQEADYQGTEQQRMACTPDVFRLCWDSIPNVSQIVSCLRRERPRLSAGCRAVFEQSEPSRGVRRFAKHHYRHHYLRLEARFMHRSRGRHERD